MQKPPPKKPGDLTFKITAVLIGLSGLFELTSMSAQTPFFGILLAVPEVMFYHFIYVALFIAVGIGVWLARPWGYILLQITCGIYVVDRLQVAVFPETIRKYVLSQLQEVTTRLAEFQVDLSMLQDPMLINQFVWIIQIMSLTIAACWLGFAIWAYWRRAYFD